MMFICRLNTSRALSHYELNRGRHSLHGLNQYLGVSLRVEIDKTEALRSEALAVAKEIRAEGDIVNCESVLGKMGSLSVSSYSPHSMRAIHYVPIGYSEASEYAGGANLETYRSCPARSQGRRSSSPIALRSSTTPGAPSIATLCDGSPTEYAPPGRSRDGSLPRTHSWR